MTIDDLLDIESIKHLRALGSKHLDSGDLKALVDLYTEDAVCEFGPYGSWHGCDTFLANFAEAEPAFYQSGYFSNLHVVTNHVVEPTGPDTASDLVYLLDFVTGDMMREGGNPLYWLGVYDERYRRADGRWRISKQSLNFVWPQRMLNDGFLDQHAPSSHLTRPTTEPFRVLGHSDGDSTMALAPDRMADLEDIRALSARYARGLDRFAIDEVLEPFAGDAVFDASPMGLDQYKGADALRNFFGHNQDVMADQMHLFSNFVIDFDGPDEAHGTNYLLQDGHNKEGATVKCFCLNEDTYRRISGEWRIASRRISPLMPAQLESY